MPRVRVLVLAIAIAYAGGLVDLVGQALCADECHEVDGRGECPPACPQCHCPARAPTAVAADPGARVQPPPRTGAAQPRVIDRMPPSPEPGEILHVPIARVA